jgi:hypothetical protein
MTAPRTAALIVAIGLALSGCGGGEDAATASSIPADATNGSLSDRIDQAGHQFRNVDADTAPTVEVDLLEDPMGGWNLKVDTTNFRWAPENVSTEAIPGEGHGHVFMDGKKVARLYGPWFHISPTSLSKGKHTVTVTLNANDHTAYAVDDVQVTDSVTVDAAGSGDGHAGHSH